MYKIDEGELYEQRLLVFFECKDGFYQVALNPKQFKMVSDAIVEIVDSDEELKPGYEVTSIKTLDKALPLSLFDGMKSIDDEVDK